MTDTSTRDTAGNDLDSTSVFIVKRALLGSGWACAPKGFTPEQVNAALDAAGAQYCEGTPWTCAPRTHSDPTLQSPGICAECADREHWFVIGGMSGVMCLALMEDASGFPEDLRIR